MTPRMKDAADHVSVTSREEPVHSRPHVVLASDFSSGPDAADVRFWSGRQSLGGISVCYRDAWESIHPDEAGCTMLLRNPLTGAGAWPPRRIDYVMVRCPERGGGPTLSIKRCELAFDQPVGKVGPATTSASSQTSQRWREPNDLKPQVSSFDMVVSDASRRSVHTSLGPA